eukprot:6912546-Prymnesium_polylepis.1
MMRARRACRECRREYCRTRRVLVLDSSQVTAHATTIGNVPRRGGGGARGLRPNSTCPRSPAMLNVNFASGPGMGSLADRPSSTPKTYARATAAVRQ